MPHNQTGIKIMVILFFPGAKWISTSGEGKKKEAKYIMVIKEVLWDCSTWQLKRK